MIQRTIQWLYDQTLRQRLPRKCVVASGDVTIRRARLFDITDVFPEYERIEVEALRELVHPGDHVLIVGGGWGITTVVASRLAGPEGQVTVYEAVPKMADLTRWAVEHNYTEAPVTIREAAVADVTDESADQFGEATEVVPVSELPEADVWQLDCEGAEVELLTAGTQPDRMVVEIHTKRGDPERAVEALGEYERRDKPGTEADQWIAVVNR